MAYTEAGKFNTRIALKHDIEANWIKAKNFIPLEGEIIIYDADENYSYQRIKIGDGITKVNLLPFDNIQADWNQSDATAADYVKNKTHGLKLVTTTQTFNSSDYDLNEHESVSVDINSSIRGEFTTYLYHISDDHYDPKSLECTDLYDIANELKLSDCSYQQTNDYKIYFSTESPGSYYSGDLLLKPLMIMANCQTTVAIESYASNPASMLSSRAYFQIPKAGIWISDAVGIECSYLKQVYHTLDENYIPDSIARKSDIAERVQANWNQSDENAPDYVKNRTHYETVEQAEVVLNDVTFFEELHPEYGSVGEYVYSVPIELNLSSLIKEGTQVVLDNFGGDVLEGSFADYDDYLCAILPDPYETAQPPSLTFYKNEYELKFIFRDAAGGPQSFNFEKISFSGDTLVVKQLDEKYIPDTIARKSDIAEQVQPDWNQNDETAPDYVKNRTHGEFVKMVPQSIGKFDGRNFDFTNGDVVIYGDDLDFDLPYKETGYLNIIWDDQLYEVACELWDTGIAYVISDKGYIFYEGYTEAYDSATILIHSNDRNVHAITLYEQDAPTITSKVVKTLDEKYIPDTIARIVDIPERVQANWNQNDENASDYVKNRTHYVENSREEIEIHLGTKECSGFTIDTSMPVIAGKTAYQSTLPQGEEDPYFNYGDYPIGSKFRLEIKQSNDCIFSQILTWHEEGAGNTDPDTGGWLDESAIGNADLTNPWDYSFGTLNTGELASIYTNDTDQYVSFYLDDTIQLSPDSVITISLYYLDSIEKVVQLDEKFIPNTIARTNGVVRSAGYDSQGNHIADTYAKKSEITDLFTPIDIMAELGAKDVSWNWYDDNWPKTDEDIVNMLTTVTANNQWPDDLFIKLFSLFETYPGILPAFGFFPKASRHGCKYKLTCSTERVEIDSYQETGSTIHPDFNFTYFINLSKDNYLELRFNYNSPDETTIDWDNINLDNLYLTFSLIPKGGNITTEQVAKLAQEQIITPILTKEEF